LRTYRGHARSGEPLVDPGSRDLVSDVVVEQLHHAAADAGFTVERDVTQADWLAELGIDAAVADGRDTWEARAAVGDLVALEGRSRAPQAAALTDPAGLGAHRVVVLSKGTRPRRR
jgi:SAM-dependent MidA family methyltransferase